MQAAKQVVLAVSYIIGACAIATAAPVERRAALDTTRLEQITGLKGSFSEAENVFKVSKPRTDVPIKVDGAAMPPFMGLTSWAAFTPAHGRQVMLMGDTVLLEDEVNPAMSVALDAGLEVTALHNHFFFDQPRVYFMHIGGMGDPDQLAAGVKKLYDKIAEIRAANPSVASGFSGAIPHENAISAAPLETVFGKKGQASNGMFKVVIGAKGTMHGVTFGNEMGLNTWAAFAGTDDSAIVDGDFAMREEELQVVLKAMRSGGINIVAIHQHMTNEQPRYMFLHYWGKGKATELAASIKKALDAQAGVHRP
ncbi:uncharacterized protein DUF1259 [Cupriavidus metallidurans]|uniref:DUF1259 domain-containing protein n=1 Tax=Cupriavidus TaxID=106589 RepID=UPI0004930602|nr:MULTISPECIES: DUF1259 domain-containing protein [Cupriavidus]MCA3193965.1 DUF1259 domain-containing protein [Cupriavidus sp.]MCA3198394.1 DUF1259 domain-containing protein [Cupriavidus sp.]MCM3608730.1 DUF1259 domain-containing protein [Cupriavidus pauculus]MDE4922858.1 DUF1259 domain-containing protein [Cupriavidus metallidurans]